MLFSQKNPDPDNQNEKKSKLPARKWFEHFSQEKEKNLEKLVSQSTTENSSNQKSSLKLDELIKISLPVGLGIGIVGTITVAVIVGLPVEILVTIGATGLTILYKINSKS